MVRAVGFSQCHTSTIFGLFGIAGLFGGGTAATVGIWWTLGLFFAFSGLSESIWKSPKSLVFLNCPKSDVEVDPSDVLVHKACYFHPILAHKSYFP